MVGAEGGGVVYDFHSFLQQISGQLSMLQKLSLVKSVKFLFQVNGTLKITAREVRDGEKRGKLWLKLTWISFSAAFLQWLL